MPPTLAVTICSSLATSFAVIGVPALGTLLRPGTGFDPADLSSFGDLSEFGPQFPTPIPPIFFPELIPTATAKSQRYESEYWSIETNRTTFAGEYAKLLVGGRYINFDG
jgi:hypothetical protein